MYKFNQGISRCILFSVSFLMCLPLQASPWLETDDVYLRSDLQLLADAGVVTVPVNTFPLPWREISEQIKKASPSELAENTRQAYYHISYKINASKKGYGKRFLKLKASQKNMPSRFGQDNDVEWGVFSNVEIDESRFSMRVSANYAQYHDKEDPQFNLDNSYFAVTTGQTNFFINTQAQWWSPSWLQSISAERRVHPAYELGLERTFIDLPLFGDVYFKTGLNQLRTSDDWKYSWRSRLSLRPVNALEHFIGPRIQLHYPDIQFGKPPQDTLIGNPRGIRKDRDLGLSLRSISHRKNPIHDLLKVRMKCRLAVSGECDVLGRRVKSLKRPLECFFNRLGSGKIFDETGQIRGEMLGPSVVAVNTVKGAHLVLRWREINPERPTQPP